MLFSIRNFRDVRPQRHVPMSRNCERASVFTGGAGRDTDNQRHVPLYAAYDWQEADSYILYAI